MIRLVIADDHAIVRAGLRALLEQHPGEVEVVGEASSIDEAVQLCRAWHPDVVLMDLRFSGDTRTGVDATRVIRGLEPPSYVLVVTNYDTDSEILLAVEAGASGYLLKDTPPAQLWAAVKSAATGSIALSPAIASRLRTRAVAPSATLTPREREVLSAVATGLSNREVARSLFLSEATVKSHLVQIFAKLDVKSRTAAVARAREQGLLAADR
ncbi:response regulator transcription factor [Nocardioides sp. Y6]|uniref:Response regulator transcription factor n=1 Tax=Nocardioides malaquae TaxID=2773426 RepID=A0ABR9RV62_9ACTN|nr:response regulator transcription factor [Nocardioides malaquae]MBE7325446.1 response regulator transcription factor [Nocardioides malaquae]